MEQMVKEIEQIGRNKRYRKSGRNICRTDRRNNKKN